MINYNILTTESVTLAKNDNNLFAAQSLQELVAAQDVFSSEHAVEILRDYFQIIA